MPRLKSACGDCRVVTIERKPELTEHELLRAGMLIGLIAPLIEINCALVELP